MLSGYLALIVLLLLTIAAIGLSLVAQNRIQAVADSAVLFAHDRAVRKGIPNQQKLERELAIFLSMAQSARDLELASVEISVAGVESTLKLCANYRDPIGLKIDSGVICKLATAKSFRVD